MVGAGVIEDYTYLWYDVRPHPNLGTVEIRAMDAQTRVEHTLGLAALIQAMVKELAEHFEAGERARATTRTRCSTRTSGSPRATGSTASSSTCRCTERVAHASALARRLLDRLREHARGPRLGRRARGRRDLIERGNGAAHRQLVVYEANHDFAEVVREIVAATAALDRRPGGARGRVESIVQWQAGPISSSSARAAAPRCPRTSPSARTAARGCASARRSSTRGGTPEGAPPRAPAARRRCAAARSPASAATGARTRRSRWCSPRSRHAARRARAGTRVARRSCSRGPLDGEWWRAVTTLFVYGSTGYEFAALAAIALFGWLLERRHGWWAPLRSSCVGGAPGCARRRRRRASVALGGNGAALALLAAWAMRDVLGRARGPRGRRRPARRAGDRRRCSCCCRWRPSEAHALAGLGGGVAGHRSGFGLARLR